MTASGELVGGRYVIERLDRAIGTLRRALATDRRLDRPVLLWMSEASGAEEDALLEIARSAGQSAIPSFLRVLDVAYDDQGVAVVLERGGVPLAASTPLTAIATPSARGLLDAVDRAAADEALDLVRVVGADVLVEGGEVMADPIALFLPLAAGERAVPASLLRARLGALLIEHAEDAAALARALDGAAPGRADPAARRATSTVESEVYRDEEPTRTFVATRRSAAAVAERPRERVAAAPASATSAAIAPPAPTTFDEPIDRAEVEAVAPHQRDRRGAMPWRIFVPLYATLAAVVIGAIFFAVRSPSSPGATEPPPAASQTSGPPAVAPAAGRVTVGLLATEDSGVRVTVDGVVQFDGILQTGVRQAWDGKERIDVWTDKGKTLGLAVNGRDLGPYSPAMNRPEWNRIDFSFWPGWSQ